MNVGILSYSSVCQRKFLPALLLNHSIENISIALPDSIKEVPHKTNTITGKAIDTPNDELIDR